MIKYYYAKDMTDPKNIALRMRGKGMQVAWQGHASWLHVAACKLKKYREDGDPKIRDVRVDERRATSAEQRWLG